MGSLLPFVIAGLVSGSIYSLAGIGLVLTYKTSGVFNFAHGSLASVAAFIFYVLYSEHHVPWPVAAVVAVALAGPILGLALERVARWVQAAPLTVKVASTVGILLVVESVIVLMFGTVKVRVVHHFLPQSGFQIDGTLVTTEDLIVVAVALVATAALAAFFRISRSGLAMQAVVEDPNLLDISGTNPTAVRRGAWVIGVTFAAASGVLLAPLYPLNATTLTLLVVQAFGAAAIGAFSRLPLTYFGGLAIGIGTALCSKYFTSGFFSGLSASLPFLVLFIVLLVFPRRWLREGMGNIARIHDARRAPMPVQVVSGVLLLGLLVSVPSFAGIHLADWSQFLGDTVMLLALGLLVRCSGQVSLCHVSFMAIGVAAFSHFTVGDHIPWLIALVLAGLVAVPVGAILAIPAIRLSGIYLALATFGFGVLLQYMFYPESFMFGSTGAGLNVPRPALPGLSMKGDRAYYYLVLVITVMLIAGVVVVNRTRLGRLLTGLGDSPTTLATSGATVHVTQVVVFCLSAFLAAMAGALNGAGVQVVSGDSYAPLTSLLFFAVVMISVGSEPWYALLGAAGIVLIPSYLTSPRMADYLELIFGLAALAYASGRKFSVSFPDLRAIARRGSEAGQLAADALIDTAAAPVPTPEVRPGLHAVPSPSGGKGRQPAPRGGLVVSDLRVTFGGLVAVDGVSVDAPAGRITGVIGPNGAGKTTLFNACSGLCTPVRGSIRYDGQGLAGKGVATRARLGVGRTFQQMRLFESLDVYGNVALGVEAGLAGGNPFHHVLSTRRDRWRVAAQANDAIDLCGLRALVGAPVGALSTGQRRLVELARCVAGSFGLLLLDEPSSGLDRQETAAFGQVLRQVVDERHVGVLLIEHDMILVKEICDYVYVLDFGRPIYDGPPSELGESATVRAAYLGGS